MPEDVTINLQGRAGLHYAAQIIAQALTQAGASVESDSTLPFAELAGNVLIGANVRILLTPHLESPHVVLPSGMTKMLRVAVAGFLALMLAGAEIRLNFAPSLGVFLLLAMIGSFWHFTRSRQS